MLHKHIEGRDYLFLLLQLLYLALLHEEQEAFAEAMALGCIVLQIEKCKIVLVL
jgi:hypothetical protein